ncbi:hypothetical protein EGW08_011541 [Elysia chlorotica]|uniref:Secreted protein n=1 Tax=Elysia chlorotica TaxID=188477 RepID=A0A3S1HJG9_ELYCH|nr:hypothetical protein EGW08_011541 [Elysia chlorotica]
MAWLVALTTVLAASAVLTESSFLKRSGSGTTCPNMYDMCITPNLDAHEQFFKSEDAAAAILADRAALEVLAADINNASYCAEYVLAMPGCENLYEDWDALSLVAGYLASSAHLDILQAAANSPCLAKEELAESAGMSLVTCYMPFMADVEVQVDMCQLIQTLETCTVGAVQTACGAGAGDFVQSLWDYIRDPEVLQTVISLAGIASEMASPFAECGQQAYMVKRLAKRAIDTVRK